MRKLRNSELNRLDARAYKHVEKLPVIVILDNVRSLHNIGSVFRTADALLIEKILLCGITATPPHPEMHKTALGAEQTVAWEYFQDTKEAINKIVEEGYLPIAVEQTEKSTPLHLFHYTRQEKYALVFGHEVKGVQQDIVNRCREVIEIPQYGTKHSFNISVSAGIVLWDFFKSLNIPS